MAQADRGNYHTYYIEQGQFDKLESINNKLFGDGSSLDPDVRRDMANLMFVVLREVEKQKEEISERPSD